MLVPDLSQAFALTARTGQYYQAKFDVKNNDWEALVMRVTPNWGNFPGIVVRFTYVQEREAFNVKDVVTGTTAAVFRSALTSVPNPDTCLFGDYFHDVAKKWIYLCYSGKGKVFNQVESVTVTKCSNCATDGTRSENIFVRNWSNPNSWPNNQLPK
jgi:hypothetical protein